MILTDQQIKEAVANGALGIRDFSEDCVEPASYDIRVGEFAYTSTTRSMINVSEKGLVILEPGDFGMILTLEEIRMPTNMAARFGLKSSFHEKECLLRPVPKSILAITESSKSGSST